MQLALFLALYLIDVSLCLFAIRRKSSPLYATTKPFLMPLLCVVYFCILPQELRGLDYQKYIIGALGLHALGDLFLLFPRNKTKKFFYLGMVCFFLGHMHTEGLVDDLIARKPSDVTADELGVHADGSPGYLVLFDLLGRQVLIDLLVEIDMLRMILLILGNAAEQLVVGVDGRTFVIDVEQANSLTPDQIEADVLVELLIAASATFLQDAHRYKDAKLLCRSTHVAIYKERT